MSLRKIEKKIKKIKQKNKTTSWLKNILLGIIAANIVITIIGVVNILSLLQKTEDVLLEVKIPAEIARGKPFDLDINIINSSSLSFKKAMLYIQLPKGILFWNESSPGSFLTDKIDTIKPNSLIKKSYKLIAVGDIGDEEKIQTSLVYFNANYNRFEINKTAAILVNSSAFQITFDIPQNITQWSPFSFKVKYTNNSGYDFSNVLLQAEFPEYYTLKQSSLYYNSLTQRFASTPLTDGNTNEIELNGVLTSPTKNKVEIPFKLFLVLNQKEYLVAQNTAQFEANDSSIAVSILVNGKEDYIAQQKDQLNYEVKIQNKSTVAIKDISVKAKISGFFDIDSVKTDGLYEKNSQTISWNPNIVPALAILEPKQTQTFMFSLNIPTAFGKNTQSIVNKNLYVRTEIVITSPSLKSILKETSIQAKKDIKIAGNIFFNVAGYKQDPLNKVANYGPFPPKTNTPSSYTIHWYITNFGNDLSNVKIQAILPQGAKFIEQSAGSNIDTIPYFDPSINAVLWEIPKIYSGSGLFNGAIDGYFGLEITPQEQNKGSPITILGSSILTADDDFTKTKIKVIKDPVYSNNLKDKPYENGETTE